MDSLEFIKEFGYGDKVKINDVHHIVDNGYNFFERYVDTIGHYGIVVKDSYYDTEEDSLGKQDRYVVVILDDKYNTSDKNGFFYYKPDDLERLR